MAPRPVFWVLVSALAGTQTACTALDDRPGPSDNPTVVTDSAGSLFGWDCDRGGCSLTRLPGTPEPPPCFREDEQPGYARVFGRFHEVCAMCTSSTDGVFWTSEDALCRPIACATYEDCPQLYEYATPYEYECRSGLCQNIDTDKYPPLPITRPVASDLCFAPYPREDTIDLLAEARFEVQAAVEEACGDDYAAPCTLPLPDNCWQL